MSDLVWLIPGLPFVGAVILIFGGTNLPRRLVPVVGAGSVGLSALMTLFIGFEFLTATPTAQSYQQVVWNWIEASGFSVAFAFHLDVLSLVFIFVITFVGFLIHLYSAEFMASDEGYARFFAYLNLFVGFMLILVMADNLLLMYLGWEGVGLCSYLLIGFWYLDEKNGYAARKAFIITRVGDTAMVIGLFILFKTFGTLNIAGIQEQAPQLWVVGSSQATLIALLLLGGAVGKSAQLPLQTWLPDAMAGPSPVSALIHAATMVTAGVYIIARTHVIFELAPIALFTVGVIGALTLLIAGFSALTQYDLKRVLAYSTISQIGYMFLALGVGAWSSAIFHFMIHAFFKALLFLGAGAVIAAVHHEHDMFKMGGLRKKLPLVYWTFLIGAASLAALPFVTAGFYSKDQILWLSWASEKGNNWLFLAALIGAFITTVYTFRMVFLTFFGEVKTQVTRVPGLAINISLVVLAILSTIGGFIEIPHSMGHVQMVTDFLSPVLPVTSIRPGIESSEWIIQLAAAILSIGGLLLAYFLYMKRPSLHFKIKNSIPHLHSFWLSGWRFDSLYDWLVVRPFVYVANINKNDPFNGPYNGVVRAANFFHRILSFTQSGILRWYLIGVVIGAILILTLGIWL
ncbi:MAG TPA: NADH-quinone oxidoreductase subunit L [Cyclobacteriaceae bacterium]|nr:NADH-quinone oxidoreductase subunit L [Cyclobacteriaceae bacterium]